MLPDDPGDQAQLFYLLILLMVFAVWAVQHYRDRLGQAVQHAALWGLIFVGTVIGVGFYEPLKQSLFADRGVQVSGDTVMLRADERGHFFASVEVNGRPITFMVDTGATSIVLSRADARRAGLKTDRLIYSVASSTANGVVHSAPVRLRSLKLGKFVDHDVPALVNSGDMDRSLLGMAYLKRLKGYRVEDGRMYLHR